MTNNNSCQEDIFNIKGDCYSYTPDLDAYISDNTKGWIIVLVHEYCDQLGIPENKYPTNILFSAKEVNEFLGYKQPKKKFIKMLGCCWPEHSTIFINVSM